MRKHLSHVSVYLDLTRVPDPHYSVKLNPDSHESEKLDPYPHWNQNSGALEAQNGAVDSHSWSVEAQNGDLDGVCRPVVANSPHFDEDRLRIRIKVENMEPDSQLSYADP